MTFTVELPWPPRILHPNARAHRMAQARVIKTARADAGWWAKAAGVKPMRKAQGLNVSMTFFPPDKRRRDTDGMLSACKAYIDGIADVVGVDDSLWTISMKRGELREFGAVRFDIEEAQP